MGPLALFRIVGEWIDTVYSSDGVVASFNSRRSWTTGRGLQCRMGTSEEPERNLKFAP